MKKYIFSSIVFGFVFIFLTGCTQKATVKTLQPAQVSNKAIKKTSLEKFKKDNVGLRTNIHSAMDRVKFNGKKYFTIVNRQDTKKILKEQELQDSGLVKDDNKGFALSSIDSVISGKITLKDKSNSIYFTETTNYDKCLKRDKKNNCIKYATKRNKCIEHHHVLEAHIKITDIHNAKIIFSKQIKKTNTKNECNSFTWSKSKEVYNKLSRQIANEFVAYISPTYKKMKIELIEDEDIDYTNSQEKLLENGLKFVEHKDYESAKELFEELVQSTKKRSETALYNLGLVYEIMGDYKAAEASYKRALNLTKRNDMNKLIIKANKRIKSTIKKHNKAKEQIAK